MVELYQKVVTNAIFYAFYFLKAISKVTTEVKNGTITSNKIGVIEMANDKVIGLLGGMGPEATASLFQKIIKQTDANSDQEHFRVIIDSNPKIPDRTQFILGEGVDPTPTMTEVAKNLENSGVDIIAIPCMTAHYFREAIQKDIETPIADAYQLLNDFLIENHPEAKTIGILATSGTRLTKQFEKKLETFKIIYPTMESQKSEVMEAIYGDEGIKAGYYSEPRQLLQKASEELIAAGADVIISGCTEIELALKQSDVAVPLVDPMEVMAINLTK